MGSGPSPPTMPPMALVAVVARGLVEGVKAAAEPTRARASTDFMVRIRVIGGYCRGLLFVEGGGGRVKKQTRRVEIGQDLSSTTNPVTMVSLAWALKLAYYVWQNRNDGQTIFPMTMFFNW